MNRYTVFGAIVAALFALLPFATSRHLFHAAVNVKFFLVIGVVLVLAAVAAGLYFRGKQTLHFQRRPFLYAGGALLVVYAISMLVGIFPERSFFSDILRSSGVYFLLHIAAFAYILGEFCTARDWSLIRRAIAVSAGVFSFCTILGTEGFGVSGRILWMNLDIPGFTLGNTTFAGAYLVLALILALIELVRTPRGSPWRYVLAGSCAIMALSPILLSAGAVGAALSEPLDLLGSARASSASMLFLLAFFGGYFVLKRYAGSFRAYLLPAWGAVCVAAVIGGVALLFTPGSVVQEKYIEASTAARLLVWEGAWEAFKAKPVLGYGPENFEQALQKHFNVQLYEERFLGEVWFDRAHNIILDTLVGTGVAGALAHFALAGAFLWTVRRAYRRGVVGEPEAVLLYTLPFVHFLQLQTGFDTIGSYALLGVFGGYALYLERSALHAESMTPRALSCVYYKSGAFVVCVLVAASAALLAAEFGRQSSLYRVFVERDDARRLERIATATSRVSSFESLRLSSASLIKGVLQQTARAPLDANTLESVFAQFAVYEERYRRYIAAQPHYYRARMNLAYLLSVERVLGGPDKLADAKEIVKESYALSPNNLLTPAMEALLELYSGNVAAAREKARELVALNPNARFSKNVQAHIERQAATFPTVEVLRLENL